MPKIVRGANFVTIEDTKQSSEDELADLITNLTEQPFTKGVSHLNILVNSKFSPKIERLLNAHGFNRQDEVITVHKELIDEPDKGPYTFMDLHTISEEEFMVTWEQVMTGSLTPSSLKIEEQMESVKIELGPSYKESCILAYEGAKPIGVTIPHIEAGTLKEGRIFYFGLIPEERSKGKSTYFHKQTLSMLKYKLRAAFYIGSTSHKNIPMLHIFRKNGCKVLEYNKVYKKRI
ncbi:hypothetical protein CYL18_18825 [Pradoshia eiseniae]|uniref:N-acetyltransferase domain-containing protein n=1 Tax=Pradoshia eiseniae TaxID=2064768 RepID=A0A2S7MV27_9BACI|nr:hypothetical protein [Pradoshia eiseniae]PQD93644.1 hypothetical protein CYL18_18825 [Pradoshia eiseniae]